jgi:hypothetical protein
MDWVWVLADVSESARASARGVDHPQQPADGPPRGIGWSGRHAISSTPT